MFDIGWSEFMVIGVVGLIVIGPKDLPDMFRTMGRFTAKARSMARDFQRAMEAAADEAGVKDVAKDLKTMTSARNMGLDAFKDSVSKFEKWDPLKPAPKPVASTPVEALPAETILGDAKPAAPMGPATKALADKQAALREARIAAAAKPATVAAPLVPAVKTKPVAKAKGAATKTAKTIAAPAVDPKPVAKPKVTKPKGAPAAAKTAAVVQSAAPKRAKGGTEASDAKPLAAANVVTESSNIASAPPRKSRARKSDA